MKSSDAIIIGGGIIGLSLAIELRKQQLSVLVLERGEPGREASYAAAGMLVGEGNEIPAALKSMAAESAEMYPEFVHELEDESGTKIDFREQGTIEISRNGRFDEAQSISDDQVHSLEPELTIEVFSMQPPIASALNPVLPAKNEHAAFLQERSVDPRTLMTALIKAAKHRGIDISSGSAVTALLTENGRAVGVQTHKTSYASSTIINCAGAWADNSGLPSIPVRPVKGQMLAVVGGPKLMHVIRANDVYLVPRTDGRIVIGSTLEEAGFNKQTNVETIEKLFRAAVRYVPALVRARQHEAWAGLRPGTPDGLPILGKAANEGYFLATGHYRDGILLAPATARALAASVLSNESEPLRPFSAERFL